MSTALWLYFRDGDSAASDEEDLVFIYRHASKLDRICRKLSLTPLSNFHDLTDADFNMGAAPLPAGMSDTRELMMLKGSWHPVSDGEATFSALLEWLKANPTRFGLLRDDYQSILAELEHCLNCFESRGGREGDFNLCVVQ